MKKGVEDFVVESTPVLDLKKGGVSQLVRHEAGDSTQNWDSDRTEVYADADGDSVIATLVGQNGERYPITTFPFVMGRGSECDLVLQGKGVSRRHAEIVFQAGRFVINDFDSLNGLKINGYKVSRVILEENDVIKLGEVSLTFRSGSADSPAQEKSPASPRKRSFFSKANQIANDRDSASEDNTFGSSPLRKMVTWASFVGIACVAAWGGLQYLNKGNQAGEQIIFSSGSVAEVGSASTRPAQEAPTISESAVVSGDSVGENSVVATSQTEVDTVIDPPPSIAPPASIAAQSDGKRDSGDQNRNVVPKDPVVSAKKVSEVAPPIESKNVPVAKAPIAKIDQTPSARMALAESEKLYFSGRADEAIAKVRLFVGNSDVQVSVRGEIKRTIENYNLLQRQYLEGQSEYSAGNKERAFELWTEFMDREAKLFAGKRSIFSNTISAKVVDEYLNLGNDAARKGDHHKAYKMWAKAVELGDNVAARIAMDNVNNKGMQLYRQALRLEYVNTTKARSLWQEVTQILPPGTEYHTKASAKLAWYDKWGT